MTLSHMSTPPTHPPLVASVTLNNGVAMPWLGLGVYQARAGAETRRAVRTALELGYRHVDTASLYANERDVAAGIEESGVRRSEVFVTTKLWNSDQGYDGCARRPSRRARSGWGARGSTCTWCTSRCRVCGARAGGR